MNSVEGFVELRWKPNYTYVGPWGRLYVVARWEGFAGRGSAPFLNSDMAEFADALDRYPLPEKPITLTGTDGNQIDDEQVILSLSVRPVGGRGQVRMSLMLVSDGFRHEEEQCVQLCVPVAYEALRRFAKDIHDLLAGGDFARIEADIG